MLHARTGDTLNFGKICPLLFQTLQDEVDSFEKQCGRSKHLALCRICEDALLNAILCEIGVKVNLSFVNEFEVRSDDNAYNVTSALVNVRFGGVALAGHSRTFQLLRAEIEAQELISHGWDRCEALGKSVRILHEGCKT
jgi:hypothetical protein